MEPVRLELAHLKEVWPTGRASENKCVFWDTDASSWSEKGCFVIESNANSTVCACDHLTSFAVLSPKSSVGVARVPTAGTDTALLMEIVICLLAVIFIVLLALLAMRVSQIWFVIRQKDSHMSFFLCSSEEALSSRVALQ